MRWVEVVGLLIRSLHLDLQSRLLCMISECVPCEHTRSTLVCWTAPLVSLSWNLVMSALVLSASSHCLDRCHCLCQLYSWRRCYVTPWPAWHGLKQLSVVALPLGYSELLLLLGISHSGPTLGSRVHPCLSPEKKAKSLDEFASLAGVRTSRTSRWKVWCWNFWFSYQRSFHKKIPPPKFNDVALQKLLKPSRTGSSLPATIFQGRTC